MKRGISITNKFLNTTVQPHSISEYDVINSNGFIPEEFEDTTEDVDQLIRIVDDTPTRPIFLLQSIQMLLLTKRSMMDLNSGVLSVLNV